MTHLIFEKFRCKVQKSKWFEILLNFFGFRKFSSNNLAIFLPKRFSNNRLELPRFHFRVKIFDHFEPFFLNSFHSHSQFTIGLKGDSNLGNTAMVIQSRSKGLDHFWHI